MRTFKKMTYLAYGLSLLFLVSCVEKEKKQDGAQEDPPKMEEEEVKTPDDIISLKEAKVLCENYEERRVEAITEYEMQQNGSEEFVPTQFIDFDFKTIRKYVRYIEREARKAGVKPDSLRIYLGNYGPDGQDPNRNTVFLLPTAKINGERGGFYIDGDGKAQLIRGYWPEDQKGSQEDEPKSKASFLPSLNVSLYQEKSLILNHGNGGPPPTGDF
ncbi:hypothetical protein [Allomuricauda sp. d1]|uniref:hypothetical protein n=1 Tax=Allomuricauda sp. d1 TaxID=3136725 RepID=UPI0031DEED69